MIMKKLIGTVLASFCLTSLMAQDIVMDGPDGKLQLAVFASSGKGIRTGTVLTRGH